MKQLFCLFGGFFCLPVENAALVSYLMGRKQRIADKDPRNSRGSSLAPRASVPVKDKQITDISVLSDGYKSRNNEIKASASAC